MILVSASRTMAGAKHFVPDLGICLRPKNDELIDDERRAAQIAEAKRIQHERAIAANEALDRILADAVRKFGDLTRGGRTLPRTIMAMVGTWHGFSVAEIMGKRRNRKLIVARHDAIAAIYENCRINGRRYSLPEVGRTMGNRDHTTILHALRKRGIDTSARRASQSMR